MYIKIYKDGSRKTLNRKPRYFFDNGQQVSESWLIENESIYPIVEETIDVDCDETWVKPESDWPIKDDHVLKTYLKIFNNIPTDCDSYELKDQSEWTQDGDKLYKTYIKIFNNEPTYDKSTHKFVLKDRSNWTQDGDKLYKTWDVYTEDIPDYDSLFEYITQDPESDWYEQDGVIHKTYTVHTRDLSDIQTKMIRDLADKRWKYETGGMEFETYKIHTDRESQSKIMAGYVASVQGTVTEDRKWKTKEGFAIFSPTQMENMGLTLNQFVQDCYDNEERILNQINNAGSVDDCKNITFDGWPSIALGG